MSKKHKKVCMSVNYIAQLLILVSFITVCVSISAVVCAIWDSYRYCKLRSRIKN